MHRFVEYLILLSAGMKYLDGDIIPACEMADDDEKPTLA
jgi:hypothetical protein